MTTVQEPPSVAIPDITFLTDNVINATENEEWEEEETLLYEWTQDLSMEQLNTTTPRLPTAWTNNLCSMRFRDVVSNFLCKVILL